MGVLRITSVTSAYWKTLVEFPWPHTDTTDCWSTWKHAFGYKKPAFKPRGHIITGAEALEVVEGQQTRACLRCLKAQCFDLFDMSWSWSCGEWCKDLTQVQDEMQQRRSSPIPTSSWSISIASPVHLTGPR